MNDSRYHIIFWLNFNHLKTFGVHSIGEKSELDTSQSACQAPTGVKQGQLAHLCGF